MKLRKFYFPEGFKYKYFMHFVTIYNLMYKVNCLLMDKTNT